MSEQINWPGWDVVSLIGKGGFAEVYEIQRDVLGTVEKAALKVIRIPKDKSDIDELLNEGYDADSITKRYRSFLEDIVREYSIMSEMKGNTNIVDCDDVQYFPYQDNFGWTIYIKMELLTPLTKALGMGQIAEEQVISLGKDICNALVLCNNLNIVHRDIKPQNIFVSKYGNYKLGDFGIAKVTERTTGGTKIGTYKYMAPEVYNNQPYGALADIYSLGLVMYWMLNERRVPFLPLPPQVPTAASEEEAKLRRFRGEAIPPPVHGSDELKRIVCKACAFLPSERYASAREMLDDLSALRCSDDVTECVVASESKEDVSCSEEVALQQEQEDADKKQRRAGIFVLSVIAALVLLLIAIVVGIVLGMGNEQVSTLPKAPYEWIMERDITSILQKEGIEEEVISWSALDASVNEKYQTYSVKCKVVIAHDDGAGSKGTQTLEISLVYEEEDGKWVLGDLSKISKE